MAVTEAASRPTFGNLQAYADETKEGFMEGFDNLAELVEETGELVLYKIGTGTQVASDSLNTGVQEVSSFLEGASSTLQNTSAAPEYFVGGAGALLALGALYKGTSKLGDVASVMEYEERKHHPAEYTTELGEQAIERTSNFFGHPIESFRGFSEAHFGEEYPQAEEEARGEKSAKEELPQVEGEREETA